MSAYFSLNSQNKLLSEENRRLKSLLYNLENTTEINNSDSLNKPYYFSNAQIIKNNYSAIDNVLLINKGINDSIKQDFGVASTEGIIGIVDKTSGNYATVISILNSTSSISAQLKKTNHYGTLKWDAKSPEFTQLVDIQKIAPVSVGDTIITSGRSSIFPKGIPIGTVANFELDASENYYEINVKLFNDMTNLEHVYIIENINKPEITNLLNE
ncbi:rod shape-determining protein MreC [Flavivirga jejuensis]